MNNPIPISSTTSPQFPATLEFGATLGESGRPTIRQAARDVETMFLSLLLKEMRQSSESDGGFFAGDSGDVYGGLFDFYMGKHMAEAGGIGLASAWAGHLEQSLPPERSHDAPVR